MALAKTGDTVAIEYTVKLDDNSVVDRGKCHEPLLLTIGEGKIIPAFEEALVGMEPGECKTLKVAASEAYGPYHEELVKPVSRHTLAEGLEPEIGQRLKATRIDGRKFSVTVRSVSDNSVMLDANHPLAGKNLTFVIQLVEIV
ncbi:MAG: FKBP-type peptidyl-prolyl cis-trans isomerase [Planctomycetota bacterium]|jgi:peptidylprolyl isomerase